VLNYLKSRVARIYTARHLAKRLIIGVVGFTILAIGVAMMVLPGPAFIVIPIGVGILATEFAWARRLLRKVEEKIREQMGKANDNKESG
jgi:tellurite resistance protein TerC